MQPCRPLAPGVQPQAPLTFARRLWYPRGMDFFKFGYCVFGGAQHVGWECIFFLGKN